MKALMLCDSWDGQRAVKAGTEYDQAGEFIRMALVNGLAEPLDEEARAAAGVLEPPEGADAETLARVARANARAVGRYGNPALVAEARRRKVADARIPALRDARVKQAADAAAKPRGRRR